MDTEIGVEDTNTLRQGDESLRLDSDQCDLSKEDQIEVQDQVPVQGQDQVQDGGEVLLVEGLQDFQGVEEAVVVDDSRSYQQYQPVVVQGFVTSTGEVVHVVQDCPAASGPVQQRSTPSQAYQQPYQPQMVHPDLYRLIKMFPDFSTKTLHRIFVMCHCDLKRALDQALFARQFRQLDSAASYNPIAPPAPHFHAAPYRTPARPPYVQMEAAGGDMYLQRGRGTAGVQPQAQPPILLYQQPAQQPDSFPMTSRDPRLNKQTLQEGEHAEVVHITLPCGGMELLGTARGTARGTAGLDSGDKDEILSIMTVKDSGDAATS